MKHRLSILLTLVITVCWLSLGTLSCKAQQRPVVFFAKVVGVRDGDTYEVLQDERKREIVRLFGVDAPEKGQAYGNKAKQFASNLAYGQTVKVIIEAKRDRYKRLVATLYLEDGSNLSEHLLQNGYAWHYTQFSDSEVYKELEKEARKYKRGLWADKKAMAPWKWRELKRVRNTR